jgi:hypothetical protein
MRPKKSSIALNFFPRADGDGEEASSVPKNVLSSYVVFYGLCPLFLGVLRIVRQISLAIDKFRILPL